MSNLSPCRHLDYESQYDGCELKTLAPYYPQVRFWRRGAIWIDNGPDRAPNPSDVQFCKLRGRINSKLDCYQSGYKHCYDPGPPEEKKDA